MAEVSVPSVSLSRRQTRTYDIKEDPSAVFAAIMQLICPTGTLISRATAADAGEGWKLCDGRALSKEDYPSLYAVLGSSFGESAEEFLLPDLRGRMLIGSGGGPAVAPLGLAGQHQITLAVGQLPAHAHGITDPGHGHAFTGTPHGHTLTDPGHAHSAAAVSGTAGTGAAVGATATGNTGGSTTGISVDSATAGGTVAAQETGITINETGSGQPINILPPVMAVHWFIRT